MDELKFTYKKEEDICKEADVDNMFRGEYKFASQKTAVYGTFGLIEGKNEIIKLDVSCDKLLVRDDYIAIINGPTMRVYKGLKLLSTMDIGAKARQLNGLPPTDFLESFLKREQPPELHLANDSIVEINDENVTIDGKAFPNTCFSPDADYFVASAENAIIVGSSKSTDFLYFLNGEQIEPEECDSLNVRVDDNFDPIMLVDAKFHGNTIILKDSQQNIYYELEGLPECTNKPVTEYCIKGDMIVQTVDTQAAADAAAADTDAADVSAPILTDQAHQALSVSAEEEKPREAPEMADDITKSLPSNGVYTVEDKQQMATRLYNYSMPEPESQKQDPVPGKKDSDQLSVSVAGPSVKPVPQMIPASRAAFSVASSSKESDKVEEATKEKVDPNAPEANGLTSEQNKTIQNIKCTIENRITKLEQCYSSLSTGLKTFPDLVMTDSYADCTKLYNMIFNYNIKELNNSLTEMIGILEVRLAADQANVESAIKHFDSRILGMQGVRRTAKYTSPLIPRLSTSLTVTDSLMENLINSVKIISVKEGPVAGNGFATAEKVNTTDRLIPQKTTGSQAEINTLKATVQPKIFSNAPLHTVPTSSYFAPLKGPDGLSAGTGQPRQSTTLFDDAAQRPTFTNPTAAKNPPLFAGPVSNTFAPPSAAAQHPSYPSLSTLSTPAPVQMQVSNPSELFKNLSTNPSPFVKPFTSASSTTQPSQNITEESATSDAPSAFSRFASSRRMNK